MTLEEFSVTLLLLNFKENKKEFAPRSILFNHKDNWELWVNSYNKEVWIDLAPDDLFDKLDNSEKHTIVHKISFESTIEIITKYYES